MSENFVIVHNSPVGDDLVSKYFDISSLIRLRLSYYSLFHPQFSRKDIGTGSIAWSCLDICNSKDSLDHLHLISDVHLKEYTPFPYVIMSPSPCAVVEIFAPFLISI